MFYCQLFIQANEKELSVCLSLKSDFYYSISGRRSGKEYKKALWTTKDDDDEKKQASQKTCERYRVQEEEEEEEEQGGTHAPKEIAD